MIRLTKQITLIDNKLTTVYYSIPKSILLRLKYALVRTKNKFQLHYLIKHNYLSPDHTPIKCTHCKSTNLIQTNTYYDDNHLLVEYTIKCKDCNTELGLWSYGNWYE